jgi:2-keto-3-deoxy-L-rhamnonate aldolase RhmA
LTWPTAGVSELLAIAGFDFAVLDSEHGFFNPESIEAMVRAGDGANLPSVVRVGNCQASSDAGRALDAGAAGALFPRADGAAAARLAIESVKYPPAGRRGLGGARANRYATSPLDRFVVEANESTLVAIQIETPGALTELSEIAQLPGVDVVFVGPNDLTQALGIPGRYDDAGYRAELARIARAATGAGRAAGIMLGKREQIPSLREMGYSFFTTSDRTILLESARAWREALR